MTTYIGNPIKEHLLLHYTLFGRHRPKQNKAILLFIDDDEEDRDDN